MGRNAQRRRQILDDLANHGLEIGRVTRVSAADGYQGLEVALVKTGADGEGYVITCDDCGRQGRLPAKPDPFPDKVRCPDCMRARVAKG